MSVLYNYLDQQGNTTNNPWSTGADGRMIDNKWQGRADGYGGGTAGLGVASNGGDFFAGAQPMPMPGVQQGGGASMGGASFGGGFTYAPNPYLQDQANGIKSQVNQNLQQQILPGIRSSSLANGTYGSSRQGIAEGVAAGNASTGIAGALANLYGGAYNTDQANQTSRMGIGANYSLGMTNAANNYDLGMGGLQNNAVAQNQGFYTSQRGQDLQQMQLGGALFGQGITGQAGVGAGQYSVGQQGYQAPWTALQQYANTVSPYTGLNSSQQISNTAPSGGGFNAAIGGALAGSQIYKNFSGGSSGSTSGYGVGAGTGAGYGYQDYGQFF